MTRPGAGEEFVYSPVEVNATIHCAVNNPNLYWGVDELNFAELGPALHLREIFHRTNTSSVGITTSTVKVSGNIETNNSTKVCCRSLVMLEVKPREACTTLIIYGMVQSCISIGEYSKVCLLVKLDRPLPPENLSVQHTGVAGLYNISWTAPSVVGVDQNYTIIFDTYTVETTQLNYYIYQQNMSSFKCSAFIEAVNGAGESDPSNNVSIPSLPDIAPVTGSLRHQVWKSDGEIMVNVSFKVSYRL